MTEATKRGGRPAIEFTPELLVQAENMAGRGAMMHQIAAALGISESTLYKYKSDPDSEFSQAIKRGRAKGVVAFTDHLFQQSRSGKTAATIFALINMDPENWKQRPPEALGGNDPVTPVRIEVQVVDGRIPEADQAAG